MKYSNDAEVINCIKLIEELIIANNIKKNAGIAALCVVLGLSLSNENEKVFNSAMKIIRHSKKCSNEICPTL